MVDTVAAIFGWSLFGAAVIIGLALDLVGLFGNWVIFGAVAIAWVATGFSQFSFGALFMLALLAVLGEVLEMAAAGYGASRFGGNRGTVLAALVGCIVGAIVGSPLFFIVGTLLGACVGAGLGAMAYEYLNRQRSAGQALWTGFGAALGRVGGLFAKLAVGILMLAVAAAMR